MSRSKRAELIGTAVTNQLRRLFLRCTSRAFTHEFPIEPVLISSRLYSLESSTRVVPGSREACVLKIDPFTVSAKLFPSASFGTCRLFSTLSSDSQTPVTVVDGLTILLPNVRTGCFKHDPVTTKAILPTVGSDGEAHCVPLDIPCDVNPGKNFSVIELFTTDVKYPQVVLTLPKVETKSTAAADFGNVVVASVPDGIQGKVPLIIRRQPFYAHNVLAEHALWRAEKKLLAAVAPDSASESDIQIIGVFKRVPISSATKIEIGPGLGDLSVFLRPKCGNVVQSGDRTKFSIAFGRVKGKKEILRVLIPE